MRSAKRLIAELDNMSPDEIAAFLYERGYCGISAASSCPVARYLRTEAGWTVQISSYKAFVKYWVIEKQIPLPHNVLLFVANFDAGRYPLLKKEDPAFDMLFGLGAFAVSSTSFQEVKS